MTMHGYANARMYNSQFIIHNQLENLQGISGSVNYGSENSDFYNLIIVHNALNIMNQISVTTDFLDLHFNLGGSLGDIHGSPSTFNGVNGKAG